MTDNFDQLAKNNAYRTQVRESVNIVNADSDLILEVKADLFIELLSQKLKSVPRLKDAKVLDVGCGIGLMDRYWKNSFGELHGIDVSKESVERAKTTNTEVKYVTYDGNKLPYADGTFDALVTVCVMHHVPPAEWQSFTSEMARVTKTGGLIAVFEHNPYNPMTQIVVNRCEFDADAVLLRPAKVKMLGAGAGLEHVDTKSILYFPWRGSFFRMVEKFLGFIPMGGQYYTLFKK